MVICSFMAAIIKVAVISVVFIAVFYRKIRDWHFTYT